MNKLYMPSNITTKREVFDGFGNKEIKAFLIISIINIIISSFVMIYNKTFQSFIISFIIISVINYYLVKKDINNYSTAVYVGYILKYFTKQNKYKYEYIGWWIKYVQK